MIESQDRPDKVRVMLVEPFQFRVFWKILQSI